MLKKILIWFEKNVQIRLYNFLLSHLELLRCFPLSYYRLKVHTK